MKLNVFGEISGVRTLVGSIATVAGAGGRFAYDPAFVREHPSCALSVSLPVCDEPFSARATRAFFINMLPEEDALRTVARQLETRDASYLKILEALGRECIGAVSIEAEALERDADSRDRVPAYEPLTRDALAAYIDGGEGDLAALQPASRLSLAGAQSKTGMYVVAFGCAAAACFSYYLPRGGAPSTHIVKSSRRRFEGLSENEHCCLEVARACGLRAPQSFLDVRGEESLFVVERYDRVVEPALDPLRNPSSVARLHQEDFCQALGRQPERKYERSGWNYVRQIAELLYARSGDPIADLRDFQRMLALNVVLGNCDAHLKNFSLLRDPSWAQARLAPAYDISSTVVYAGLERHMAMRIGTTYDVDKVRRSDFEQLADDAGMSRRAVLRELDAVLEGVNASLVTVVERVEEKRGAHLPKLHELAAFANRQVHALM